MAYSKRMDEWMTRFYALSNSVSVISGRWEVDKERLCAVELRLRLRRFHLQRGSNSVHTLKRNELANSVHTLKRNELANSVHTLKRNELANSVHTLKRNELANSVHSLKRNELANSVHTLKK